MRHLRLNCFWLAISVLIIGRGAFATPVQPQALQANKAVAEGDEQLRKGNQAEAWASYTRAIHCNDLNSRAWEGRARVRVGQGRYPEALREVTFALLKSGENSERLRLHFLKAQILEKMGNTPEALESLKTCLSFDRNFAPAISMRDRLEVALKAKSK